MPASAPVLLWAAQRARLKDEAILQRYPKWHMWLSGEAEPTLKQLEGFAKLSHTPMGYFFLPQPPHLPLPLPDFRTHRDEALAEASPELLDTLYLCQQRQDWYEEHAKSEGQDAVAWVGQSHLAESPAVVAERLREILGLSVARRSAMSSWEEALRQMVAQAEQAGVLVMMNSVVGHNTHRPLSKSEFRGFALVNAWAPLVFINTQDFKSAQMFTLAHELAHVALGQSALSNPDEADAAAAPGPDVAAKVEAWCNAVAAELLVPAAEVRMVHRPGLPLADEVQRLAKHFKVSGFVVLRRLNELGLLSRQVFWEAVEAERQRIEALPPREGSGGSFYANLLVRVSKRFAAALVSSTLGGSTRYSDAFYYFGIKDSKAFTETATRLGFTA